MEDHISFHEWLKETRYATRENILFS